MTDLPFRLTPAMASRKLQALDFITRYLARWGGSPSYDEIAAELGVGKTRARALVRQLQRDGAIARVSGQRRGIELVQGSDRASLAGAILELRRRGFRVDEDILSLSPPCTNAPLPVPIALDHIPDIEFDGGDNHGQAEAG